MSTSDVRRVHFTALVPVQSQASYNQATAVIGPFTTLYALGDDGRVYFWTGIEWKLTAPSPMVNPYE